MKKILALLITFLLWTGLIINLAHAQEFDFKKAHEDYSYNLSLYDVALNSFQNARARYLQFDTLASKETLQENTFKMLEARDEVVKTFLSMIRMNLRELKGLNDPEKGAYYQGIDQEFAFFEDHKSKLNSAGSLDDLIKDLDEAGDRYKETTEIVMYKTLIGIATGKNQYLRKELQDTINELKSKLIEIRQNGDKDVSNIDRSLVDLENKLIRSVDKDNLAKDMVNAIKTTERDKKNKYNDALSQVQSSFLDLKEVNYFLQEIIRQIKTN